jgi:putative CocE/NonD family hydrolase
MFLDSGGFSNAYQGGIRQGGAFEMKQVTWAYRAAFESPEILQSPQKKTELTAIDIKSWFAKMPWRRGKSPLSPAKDYEDYVYDQWEHGRFDGFWKQLGIYAEGFYDQFADVPMTHMSSWYDPYPRTATDNYAGLSARKKGPVRLILGPWTHGDRSRSFSGDVDFGPDATLDGALAPDHLSLRIRWFDHWLKGIDNGVGAEPGVRIFVMGGGSGKRRADGRFDHGGQWRSESHWPLPGTNFTKFHLQPDKRLTRDAPNHAKAGHSFRSDPDNPVPSIGGSITSGEPIMAGGAFDQRLDARFFGAKPPYAPLSARPDVLVFQTEPLADDVEIIGPISAELWVSSDRKDTDFTVKLIDVYPANADYPDGFAMNLCDGILRCRYRNSWENPEPMIPGEIVKITVTAFPTANLFKRGHRIRLDIASSNFPHFDVNPNSYGPEGGGGERFVATNQIHCDRDHPSHVLLPLVTRAS